MSSTEVSLETAGVPWPDSLVPVGEFSSYAEGSERGLVVLAMGLPYWLVAVENRFVLLIERGSEAAVADQLARFEREIVGWPPAPFQPAAARGGAPLLTPVLWGLSLIAAFGAQQHFPAWAAAGSLDAAALFDRSEWWRPVTALFLHGDVGHLVSNLVPGVFVCSAVLSTFGRRLGWLLLALTSIGGNLASAAIRHPAPYDSVGASTAIFAGLGLLTGRALLQARHSPQAHRWRGVFVPLGAGLILLALFGAGGPRVDLGAHLCGFVAGLVGGAANGALSSGEANPK